MRLELPLASLFAAAAALAGAAWAAPAPKRKVPPPPVTAAELEGEWRFAWGGCRGECYFGKKGDWHCQVLDSDYTGAWRILPDGRLKITEARLPEDPEVEFSMNAYFVTFNPRGKGANPGRVDGAVDGQTFRLRRPWADD